MYYERGYFKAATATVIFTCFILWLHFSLARHLAETKMRFVRRARLHRSAYTKKMGSAVRMVHRTRVRRNNNNNNNNIVRPVALFVQRKNAYNKVKIKRGDGDLKGAVRLFEDDFLAAGATCTRAGPGTFPRCPPGYWCLGADGARTCALREQLGGSCSDDMYRCGPELKCMSGVCEDDLFLLDMYLEYGKACGMNAYQRCKPGLWCIESACRKLVPCGGECDGVRFVCRPGLECMYVAQKQVKLCRPQRGSTPEAVLFGGDTCTTDGTRCKIGLLCVVRNGVGTCRKPARLGAACGTDTESDCEVDRSCVGGKCTQTMLAGQHCDASMSLICDDGLTCTDNTCV